MSAPSNKVPRTKSRKGSRKSGQHQSSQRPQPNQSQQPQQQQPTPQEPPQPNQQQQQSHHHHQSQQPSQNQATNQIDHSSDYQLLLTPMFSAMTKITDHLFLTGVGGMTRENFRKNHIDFVINITTEAPFWEDVECMRVPLEDDASANILTYLDMAVDRINEAITRRNAHVLVHCVAGVSRSATIVIAYLMKYRRMDLRSSFNYCYSLRPVIRPNNGFMVQLINYESQLFSASSVRMVDADVEGTIISVPNFFIREHPKLVLLEVMRVKELQQQQLLPAQPPLAQQVADAGSKNQADDGT